MRLMLLKQVGAEGYFQGHRGLLRQMGWSLHSLSGCHGAARGEIIESGAGGFGRCGSSKVQGREFGRDKRWVRKYMRF